MKHKESSKRKSVVACIIIVLLLAIIATVLLVHKRQENDDTTISPLLVGSQQSESDEDGQKLPNSSGAEEDLPNDNNADATATVDVAPDVFEEEALESVMADGIEISTPIGNFYYSKAWEEYAEIKYISDGQSFTAVIQATIGNYRADIMAIHLDNDQDGNIIGSAPDADGNRRKICLELYEIDTGSGLSQSEFDTLYAMQEGVNQIIEQIMQLYGYVPA